MRMQKSPRVALGDFLHSASIRKLLHFPNDGRGKLDVEGLFPQEKDPLHEPQHCTSLGKML
jgi:hypothetical protein